MIRFLSFTLLLLLLVCQSVFAREDFSVSQSDGQQLTAQQLRQLAAKQSLLYRVDNNTEVFSRQVDFVLSGDVQTQATATSDNSQSSDAADVSDSNISKTPSDKPLELVEDTRADENAEVKARNSHDVGQTNKALARKSGHNPNKTSARFIGQPVAKETASGAKTFSSGKLSKNIQLNDNYIDSSLPSTPALWHTGRAGESEQQQGSRQAPKKSKEISQLPTDSQSVSEADKGLIEAQINDVLSSAEFLALEQSAEFLIDDKPLEQKNSNDTNDPEFLLNQLDESDLMDYVAEDDLWKEQLTIEDEP